jgi:hypothetical protein
VRLCQTKTGKAQRAMAPAMDGAEARAEAQARAPGLKRAAKKETVNFQGGGVGRRG